MKTKQPSPSTLDDDKAATITLRLKADSGYSANHECRVSAKQYGQIIAICQDGALGNAMGAAPELLEALREIESAVDWYLGRSGFTQTPALKGLQHSQSVSKMLFDAHDKARAAIAKAAPSADVNATGAKP